MSRPDHHDVDPRLRALYDRAATDEPPTAIDDALRAGARRAVAAAPVGAGAAVRQRRVSTWWPLAAAATIGAIAIGLVEMMPPDEHNAPAVESLPEERAPASAPAPAPAPPVSGSRIADTGGADTRTTPSAVAPSPAAPAKPSPPKREVARAKTEAPPRSDMPAARADSERQRAVDSMLAASEPRAAGNSVGQTSAPAPFPDSRPPSPAPAPPPVAMTPPPAAPATTAKTQENKAVATANMQPRAAESAPVATAKMRAQGVAREAAAPTFDERVKRIEGLVRDRRFEEARRELARLREEFPDRMDVLAPELRALLPAR